MRDFWYEKRVVVTGGTGFLGSYVLRKLQEAGCNSVFVPQRQEYDLREQEAIVRLFEARHPNILIHLAAVVGGIGANWKHPGQFFYDNAIMGIQMLEYARRYGVGKFVCVGTVCSYPKFTPVPFREADLWNGFPEETNAPYGIAKKMLLVQAQAYKQEYGFKGIYLIPANLYGPRDNFDPETSHVIAALIRKCVEAKRRKQSKILAWGTGQATREFLYVEDAAEAIVTAAEKYEDTSPINLGSGEEIRILDLAVLIKSLVRFEGEIEWDATRPDGQPRRALDTTRALEQIGWRARTPLEEGLRRTIDWFVRTYGSATTPEHQR